MDAARAPWRPRGPRTNGPQLPRVPRSRNGCLTCKRRKVRCSEQRPRCYHCDRLSLPCVWKDTATGLPSQTAAAAASAARQSQQSPDDSDFAMHFDQQAPFADLFDFASSFAGPGAEVPSLFRGVPDLDLRPASGEHGASGYPLLSVASVARSPSPTPSDNSDADRGSDDTLAMTEPPPILQPIENGPRWASARAFLEAMAASSAMVRCSRMAFAALQRQKKPASLQVDHRPFYDRAAKKLAESVTDPFAGTADNREDLKHILTTIFFLSYIDVS